jgi:hypothetical protein
MSGLVSYSEQVQYIELALSNPAGFDKRKIDGWPEIRPRRALGKGCNIKVI